MAKKKVETKEVENVDIDALVNEGKNVDTVKVAEIIADNEEKNNEADEVKVEDLIQEANDTQAEEMVATVMSCDEEDGAEEDVPEEDGAEEDGPEEDGNIDDVISECTGKMDVKEEETPKKKQQEPWFMARAKRMSDYYNW